MLLRFGQHNNVPLLGGNEFKKGHPSLMIRCCNHTHASNFEGRIERIREMFKKVEISPSAFDTAWVAMVPSSSDRLQPCFPECSDWVKKNQQQDGSWGLNPIPGHDDQSCLLKDYLSSTLACVLELRKWSVGEQQVQTGLEYIKCNSWAINDKDQVSPLEFEIVFPEMLDIAAKYLDLNVALDPATLATIMNNNLPNPDTHDIKRRRRRRRRRRKSITSNGSTFFNSPATAAAALIRQYDAKAFQYLRSALDTYKNWVPTLYPVKLFIRLSMVDALQRLGVSRYFRDEIANVLDQTYRVWEQKHEEIVSDVVCCAMAFRLLRMNAYQVSSDNLVEFSEEEYFTERKLKHNISGGITAILELYKASQLSINTKHDHVLHTIHGWTTAFLEKQLLNKTISDNKLYNEVDFALKNCHATIERLQNLHSIEVYDVHKVRLLKTCYRCPNIDNPDFLACSLQDFKICQALHQKELQLLERWYKHCGLDELKFSGHYLESSYFLIAATLFEPEMFQARIAWTQVLILITVVDNLFDNRGSTQEKRNIFELVKLWDEDSYVGYCSKDVEISFTAIHKTVDELAAKASVCQGRCVRHHLISLWQQMVDGYMREVEWSKGTIPGAIDEYLSLACITVGSTPLILTTMYFLGEILPQHVVQSEECRNLCSHVAVVSRLNNDLQTFKKERGESKVNSVSLQVLLSGRTEEEAIRNIKEMTEGRRKQLLQMVLQSQPMSLLPKICKDLFWITSKISYYLYSSIDEFNSPNKILNHINAVLYDPPLKTLLHENSCNPES